MRRRLTGEALAVAIVLTAGVAPGADDVVRARLVVRGDQAVVEATIAPGWHVNAHEPRDAFMIPTTLVVTPPPGVAAGEVVYPDPIERRLTFAGPEPVPLYEGSVRFAAPLEGTAAAGAPPVRAALRYQACDDARCLPPRTLALEAEPAAAAGARTLDGGADEGPADDRIARWIARLGLAPTLVLVALLGVALNLTPCVYPLISVTIAFFGGRAGGEDSRTLLRALLYALGICLSFSILGVTAALTGTIFGAALQQPLVPAGIALVLVALALSNFGLYTLRFPAAVTVRLGRVGEGGVGALAMGLTMGVVAAPCIGPLVAALLVFVGARQSVGLGFALFFALGLGMGLPYVGLAALAGRLRRLPRAGAWLAWVERLFGFLLLGLAIFFAAPLLPAPVVRAVTALLGLSAAVVLGFLGAREMPRFAWARRVAGLVLAAGALGGLLMAETRSSIAWTPFSDAALSGAIAAGRPVLIDFEAEWCLPCREMDRTTFRDPDVARAASALSTLRVDVTTGDEQANALMARFRVAGVPTYVLIGRDGVERRRFVGFVPAERMIEAMRQVARGARDG